MAILTLVAMAMFLQSGVIEARLHFKELGGQGVEMFRPSSISGSAPIFETGFPYAKEYTLPKIENPIFFQVVFKDREEFTFGVMPKPKQNMPPQKIWVDWNSDKKFTSEEAIPLEKHRPKWEGWYCYGPAFIPGYDNKTSVRVCFVLAQDVCFFIYPDGIYETEIALGKKTYKIALVDMNTNGRVSDIYASPYNQNSTSDFIFIDYNGDGKLEWENVAMSNYEGFPISPLIQLPDGGLYSIDFDDKNHSLKFKREKGTLGRVKTKGDSLVVLSGRRGTLWMRSVNGGFSLPIGRYAIDYARVQYPTPREEWMINVSKRDGRDLIVEAGKTTELPVGPPFKLSLQVDEFNQKHFFKFSLSDSYGNMVVNIQKKTGVRPPPPRLQIVNADGKVLDSPEVHYG
ncbi:MAG TPA: hypothetical protein VNK96_06245 [Fimbriimonadales bacterium]|nr:hypothetical protein [Fimbriimonadales bacterium]